ncbi:MAG: metallophosphoesterase [Fimbriimonadaceae bacterium]|nr:MAG: metallophosphoesterase [Fimbriimonadaceae bacterium]
MALTRRDLFAATAAGVLLPAVCLPAPRPDRKRVLRIAHLTDIHVQPEKGAPEGMEACLAHAQSQKDKPNLIVTGGDLIMDAFGASEERTKTQWDIFTRVMKANAELPVRHTVGNHDVWAWGLGDAHEKHPMFAKAWACHALGLEKPYYSFDQAGWHFVVLDSTFRAGNGYTAKLDDEQFEWLADDLAKVDAKTNVMVVSHIPILAVCSFFDGENEKSGNWVIPGSWVHIDARRIKDLFKKNPNVRLCVSGHEHLTDQVVYNNVAYFCNGAVSGGWWGGDYHECTYGYALVDLFDDGSFENRYVPYGWKTRG